MKEEKIEKNYVKRLKMITSNIGYIALLVAIIVAVIMLIVNWSSTVEALGKMFRVIMPFILGFLFAFLIQPLIRGLMKLFDHIKVGKGMKIKKAISMLLSYVIVLGVLAVIVIFVAPQIAQSVRELGKTVQRGYDFIRANPDSFLDWIPFVNTQDIMEKLKDNITEIATNTSTIVIPYIYSIFNSTFVLVYDIFFGLVISIYMSWEKDSLVRSFHRLTKALAPKKYAESTWKTLLECNRIFNGFLLGKVIDSLIIGVITFIAMTVFQFPYPVLLSVIVCVTNMIPYFGPIIGAIPGCAIYLFIDPQLVLWFALLILVVQQFDGWILGPWILGDQTGIKPLAVILGITVGGAYFGVLGMFLGVPTVAVLKYLGSLLVKSRLKKKGLEEAEEKEDAKDKKDKKNTTDTKTE